MVQRLRKSGAIGRKIVALAVPEVLDRYLPGMPPIEGRRITGIFGRGKFIVFKLDKGHLVCHNAMSGYWDTSAEPWTFDYVEGRRTSRENDVRASLLLEPQGVESYHISLRFHDARKFGSLLYYDVDDALQIPKIAALGPDALQTECLLPNSPTWNVLDLATSIDDERSIKEILLDQSEVAGIGNIYAAEALWLARIDPRRAGRSILGPNQSEIISTLFNAVRLALQFAITRELRYDRLYVYRRKECPACRTGIERVELGGRTTHFCPTCQR
jgi:formamidopyrimidine-DNA glycosylase